MISTFSDVSNYTSTSSILDTSANIAATYDGTNWSNNGSRENDSIFEQYHPCDPRNVNFNCSEEDFLIVMRGLKHMPLQTAILVTIFFVGIFATGVIGNLIVCVVIVRHASMHTATNYYLFSLAVSDLLFLMTGLPNDLILYWHQYPYNLGLFVCKGRALLSEASTYVSVLTIVAFSMERFLAICHPLHLRKMSGLHRAVRIIAALWVVSIISAVPFAVFTEIDYLSFPPTGQILPDSAFCAMLKNPEGFPLWEVSTTVFFAIPMVIMIIMYGRMGLKIRSRTRKTATLGVQQGSIHGESKQSQARKAIIRMLAVVVITFFICWCPFHAQRLMYLYGQDIEHFKTLNAWLFSVGGWFYYVSCTINPILYNVMSHRYRIAFRETLCSRKKGYYSGNGFSRDQSSFRETTIAAAGRDHSIYESSQLIRAKSMTPSSRLSSRYKDREKRQIASLRWKDNSNASIRSSLKKDGDLTHSNDKLLSNSLQVPSADVVVSIRNDITGNAKPQCFTTSITFSTNTIITTASSESVTNLSNSSSPLTYNKTPRIELTQSEDAEGELNEPNVHENGVNLCKSEPTDDQKAQQVSLPYLTKMHKTKLVNHKNDKRNETCI